MRTRSQSRRRRQQQTPPVVVENFDLEEPIVNQNIIAMADNRTMAQMLQAPIEGYEDAIVVPPINANNFELKQPLINLVQSNKFTGRQDPHNHLRFFNKVTSTFRHPEVPNTSIKLLLFPFSLDGEARDWSHLPSPTYQAPPYQPPTNQPLVNQALPPGVSKTDFESYAKANDANMNNLQMKLDNFQRNQNDFQRSYNDSQKKQDDFQNLMLGFMQNYHNNSTASTSRPGTLPSQTVTNPRQQINAITTRSGKTLEEPSTPLVPTPDVSIPLKEPEQNPETSTEKVQNPNLENTAHVPPPGEEDSIFIEIPKPKAKKTVNLDPNSPNPNSYQSKLPYPERMKVRENDKPSAQHSRFLKMFKQLLPEKLEDPGKFLIPCALQELNRTSALADSGASINLLPYSIYKKLELEALTPTRMTLEIANRSITHPMGIAEDVVVRVDGFTFLADFVVVNFEPDPRVPMIRSNYTLKYI
ncbi:reverse transcriptase domain-containing protein [Tanacetum coccineum]